MYIKRKELSHNRIIVMLTKGTTNYQELWGMELKQTEGKSVFK